MPPDGADDVTLMTVTGSAFFDFVDGSGSNAALFAAPAITSASLSGSEFLTEPGVYHTDGTFAVPVVKGDAVYDRNRCDQSSSLRRRRYRGADFTSVLWENLEYIVHFPVSSE